jgi:hypothetical protein
MIVSLSLFAIDFFSVIVNFYAEDKLDEASNIIYRPPPLHEVWLDEEGRCKGNKDHFRQHR